MIVNLSDIGWRSKNAAYFLFLQDFIKFFVPLFDFLKNIGGSCVRREQRGISVFSEFGKCLEPIKRIIRIAVKPRFYGKKRLADFFVFPTVIGRQLRFFQGG